MAWEDTRRLNTFLVEMVDRNGTSLGILTKDNGSSCFVSGSITLDYYTDLRRIAKLSTEGDNYIDNAMFRIKVITSVGDEADLGVFCPKDVSLKHSAYGGIVKDYDLASIAYKVQTSQTTYTNHFVGTKKLLDVSSQCEDEFVEFEYVDGVEGRTHNYSNDGWVVEACTSRLDMLSTICGDFNVRYEPFDYKMVISPYVRPAIKTPVYRFDMLSGVISGDIEIKEAKYSTINRAIAKFSDSTTTLIGVATAGSESSVAPQLREQYVCETFDIQDLSPVSQQAIDKEAKKILENNSDDLNGNQYSFYGLYVGLREGDVVELMLIDGLHKCMISSMDINLTPSMMCHYVLKELPNV